MKAEEIRPIVEYLIEVYFENNWGIEDYKEKDTIFECYNKPSSVKVDFYWSAGLNESGKEVRRNDAFYFEDGEKITNLEKYVWEAIDRILEVPYYDERPREDDPTLQ